ncbi:MAG: hypothetical protein M0R50_08980, partial [Candidatus Cloacimonetes bacterium]|nr:hypothetical protein [Candidatus Cloacimonadota bacterium]
EMFFLSEASSSLPLSLFQSNERYCTEILELHNKNIINHFLLSCSKELASPFPCIEIDPVVV